MSKFRTRLAVLSAMFLAASLLSTSPAGAQAGAEFCLGLTPAAAEAQGFRVQIGTTAPTSLLVETPQET